MREIKFRAWDKESKRMHTNFKLTDIFRGDRSEIFCDDPSWVDPDLESAVIMQYTGLKDNHGKEISEGDIVEGDGRLANKVYAAKVVWHYSEWKLISITGFGFVSGQYWDNLKVIGNIYENTELMQYPKE
jgi:hypothetical protein